MNKLRGSVIGLGKMGISHAAIIGAHTSVEMVSVCDTSSMILDAFRKYTQVNTYSDYRMMIDKEFSERGQFKGFNIDQMILETSQKKLMGIE